VKIALDDEQRRPEDLGQLVKVDVAPFGHLRITEAGVAEGQLPGFGT
jgi:hypothetical protein